MCGGYWLGSFPWRVASVLLGGHRLGGMERAGRDWWPLLMVASVASVGLDVIPSVHFLTGSLGVDVGQLCPRWS